MAESQEKIGVGIVHNYPSDISVEQFEIIRPDLEGAKKKKGLANRICTMFFVQFCIFFKAEFSGECTCEFSELEIGLLLLQSLIEA